MNEVLFLVLLLVVLYLISFMMDRMDDSASDQNKAVREKCPPHHWDEQHIHDQVNNQLHVTHVCRKCGGQAGL